MKSLNQNTRKRAYANEEDGVSPKKRRPVAPETDLLMINSPFGIHYGDEPSWYHNSDEVRAAPGVGANVSKAVDDETVHYLKDVEMMPRVMEGVTTWVPQATLVNGVDHLTESIEELLIHGEEDRAEFDCRWLQRELELEGSERLHFLIQGLTSYRKRPQAFATAKGSKITGECISQISDRALGPAMSIVDPDTVLMGPQDYQANEFHGSKTEQKILLFRDLYICPETNQFHIALSHHSKSITNLPQLGQVGVGQCNRGRRPIYVSFAQNSEFPIHDAECTRHIDKWIPVGKVKHKGISYNYSPVAIDAPSLHTTRETSCWKTRLSFAFLDWRPMDVLLPVSSDRYALIHTIYISRTTLSAMLLLLKNHVMSERGIGWIIGVCPEIFWNVYIRLPGFFSNELRTYINMAMTVAAEGKKELPKPFVTANKSALQSWRRASTVIMAEVLMRMNQRMPPITNMVLSQRVREARTTHPSCPGAPKWDRSRSTMGDCRQDIINRHIAPNRGGYLASMPVRDDMKVPIWHHCAQDPSFPMQFLDVQFNKECGRTIVTRSHIPEGALVVEYLGELVTEPLSIRLREAAYDSISEYNDASYVFHFTRSSEIKFAEDAASAKNSPGISLNETQTTLPQYMLDATAESLGYGRLINHSKRLANCVPRIFNDCSCNIPRLCFIAKRTLQFGEELRIDYGDKSKQARKHHPWLSK